MQLYLDGRLGKDADGSLQGGLRQEGLERKQPRDAYRIYVGRRRPVYDKHQKPREGHKADWRLWIQRCTKGNLSADATRDT